VVTPVVIEATLVGDTIELPPMRIIVKRQITKPEAPALGQVYSASTTSLVVPLDRPATGPTQIESYSLERSPYLAESWTEIASGINIFVGGLYTDTGLTAETQYQYRCRASDTTGRVSDWSAAAFGQTPSAGSPEPPSGLFAASIANGIRLTWSAPAGGGDSYQLYRSNTGDPNGYWGLRYSGPLLTFDDTGMVAGTTWHYRATTTRGGEVSAPSSVISGVTGAGTSLSVKWYPGHYALAGSGDSVTTRLNKWDDIASSGGWAGGHARYYWGDFETSLGNYDFTLIWNDVNRLASHGLKLIIQINAARFGVSTVGSLVPSYLLNAAYDGGVAVLSDRVVIRQWVPAVIDRLLAFEEAMAAEFEGNDTVAGLVVSETAHGNLSQLQALGFTTTAYIQQIKRRIDSAESYWANTPHFLYFNWLTGADDAQKADLGAYCAAHKCGLGGPDIKPPELFDGMQVYTGAIGGVDYRGVVPVNYANQGDSVNNWTMSDLYDFALYPLECNYMSTLTTPDGDPNTWASIKAFVLANQAMIEELPTIYG
jgi:hypothetical protein